MKLIIDIPEEQYTNKTLINTFGCYSTKLDEVIYNGILLEDIKADIIRHSKICDPEFKDAFEVTVQIIDKHISEDKE